MLDPAEAADVARRFGVAMDQVRRDHLISHLLGALATIAPQRLMFFGGTALARTYLPDGRLSEDLDLMATTSRKEVLRDVERVLTRGVRREYGVLSVTPSLGSVRDVEPVVVSTDDGLRVRIQLLEPTGYPPWPRSVRALVQRYKDTPPATFTVPTEPAFAAWKTVAWLDRRSPRDLYDLWGLARIGAIDAVAVDLFSAHGPFSSPPEPWMFRDGPDPQDWTRQLSGQTRIAVPPDSALRVVADAWRSAVRASRSRSGGRRS